jgi:hypothetical protein
VLASHRRAHRHPTSHGGHRQPCASLSRRSPRAVRCRALARATGSPLHIGLLIATFRCAAPARCGAFVDVRRIVAGDDDGRVRHSEPPRPWSRRSLWALRLQPINVDLPSPLALVRLPRPRSHSMRMNVAPATAAEAVMHRASDRGPAAQYVQLRFTAVLIDLPVWLFEPVKRSGMSAYWSLRRSHGQNTALGTECPPEATHEWLFHV